MIGRGMALFAILSALILASPAVAPKRVALVIGNDKYDTLPQLNNAGIDARGMAAKLQDLGFDVILKLNASRRGMVRALAEFEGRASAADVGLVFYAGHGIQADGTNYLIPSNAQIEVEVDLRSEGMDSRDFLTAMKNAGTRLNIVIMDACRDNPLPKRSRSAARGLTVTAVPSGIKGTAIVYSAAPGQTAQDGPKGGHGVFTGALLAVLDRPGLKLEDVFKQTAIKVASLTNNRQKPWINSSITGDFVFNPAAPLRAVAPLVPHGARPSGNAAELLFWESIKDSNNPSAFKAYLAQYPDGSFATLARLKVDEFAPKQTASLPPSIKVEELDAIYVALKTVNVRSAPTTASAKVGGIARDTGVTVTGTVAGGKWFRIERPGGQVGYIFASLLAPVDGGEIAAWGKVKDAKAATEVTAFLRSYPAGHFAARAKQLHAALTPRVATIIPPRATAPRPVKPVVGIYPARRPGDSFQDCADCPELVVIPSGSFRMGDLQGGGKADEKPVHDVRIGYSFAVGKFEVTFAEWDACVSAGGCGYRPNDRGWGRGRHPVMHVSWDDAQTYISWLSAKSGQSYRLLSESEWEYVARAGTGTNYSWGNQFDGAKASMNGQSTKPVGSYEPNGFGLYDMHGNVWEWVADCKHYSYQGAPTDGSAWTSGGKCSSRVLYAATIKVRTQRQSR